MSVEVSIICDCCSMIGHAGKSARDVRRQLREYGWRTALPGGQDLCPDCSEPDPALASGERADSADGAGT